MKKISIPNAARGFTLIEILIVVSIIAILASSVLVGFGPTQKQGRDTRRISDLRQVQNALEIYYAKCGYYPGGVQAGTSCASTFSATANWADLKTALKGSTIGINNVPDDPSANRTYYYGTDSTGSNYVIKAVFEDVNNPSLRDSYKTDINGVTCAGAADYCVRF